MLSQTLHRKLTIEQYEPKINNQEMNSDTSERYVVHAPPVTPFSNLQHQKKIVAMLNRKGHP
jgi:hypothetical protein